MRKLPFIGLLLAVIAISACSQGGEVSQPPPSATAQGEPTLAPAEIPQYALLKTAPDFTLPSANSSPVTLSQLSAEKPVVLVFYRAFW